MTATGRSDVRHPDDFYRTPAWLTRAVLPHLDLPARSHVLDPACGDGAILDVVREAGHLTTGYEIDDGRAAIARERHVVFAYDSLTIASAAWRADVIVMNPPFRDAMAFVERAIACAPVVACLLRLNWLAGQKRASFWREHPADVYVSPRRPSFTGKGTDATEYAWFVWGPNRGGRWAVLDVENARAA